jgi:hypothetical protein
LVRALTLGFRVTLFIVFRLVWTFSLFPFALKYLFFTLIGRTRALEEFLVDGSSDPDPHMTLHYATIGFYEPEVMEKVNVILKKYRDEHFWLREPINLSHHRHRIKGESRLMPVIGLLPIGFDKLIYRDTLRIIDCLTEISQRHAIDWRLYNLFGLGVSGTIRSGKPTPELETFLLLIRRTVFWRAGSASLERETPEQKR